MSFVRTDGRAADELRAVKITPGFLPYAEGSVLIEMGQTRVICSASIEDRVPPVSEKYRTGVGHCRICNAAALDSTARPARDRSRRPFRAHT